MKRIKKTKYAKGFAAFLFLISLLSITSVRQADSAKEVTGPPDVPTIYPITDPDLDGHYMVSWTDESQSGAIAYNLYEWYAVDETQTIYYDIPYTSYWPPYKPEDKQGLYYYAVQSVPAEGIPSDWSEFETINVLVENPLTFPDAPSLNTPNDNDANGSYQLNWSDESPSGATVYEVWEDEDTDFTECEEYSEECVSYWPSTNSQWVVKTPEQAGTYYYKVRSWTTYPQPEGGLSSIDWSNTVSIDVNPDPELLPGTPTLNQPEDPDDNGYYEVSWDETTLATTYELQEASEPNFEQLDPDEINTHWITPEVGDPYPFINLLHDGPGPLTFYYRVRAWTDEPDQGGVYSNWSNTVSLTINPPAPLTPPLTLYPPEGPDENMVYLIRWSPYDHPLPGYDLWEDTDPNFSSPIFDFYWINNDTMHQINKAQDPPGQYYYRVRYWNNEPENGGQHSVWSNVVSLIHPPGYSLNLDVTPHEAEQPNYVGAAAGQTVLDYLGVDYSQEELYIYGRQHNYPENSGASFIDASGMEALLDNFEPGGYSFGTGSEDTVEPALAGICFWIANEIPGQDPEHSPGAAPTFGGYPNWMTINGVHTSDDPTQTEEYTLFGLWVSDPKANGIGADIYVTASDWVNTYYKPLISNDELNGKYVYVVEPPTTSDAKLTIAESPSRLAGERSQGLPGEPPAVSDEEVIQAALDGLQQQLLPYDSEFANIMEGTTAAQPIYVEKLSEFSPYYLVKFNTSLRNSQPPIYQEQEFGVKSKVRDNSMVQGNNPSIAFVNIQTSTVAVVLIDALDLHFISASFTEAPYDYLPISAYEAIEILQNDGISVPDDPEIDAVWQNGLSLYYPSWRVVTNEGIYYVTQEGQIQGGELEQEEQVHILDKIEHLLN